MTKEEAMTALVMLCLISGVVFFGKVMVDEVEFSLEVSNLTVIVFSTVGIGVDSNEGEEATISGVVPVAVGV